MFRHTVDNKPGIDWRSPDTLFLEENHLARSSIDVGGVLGQVQKTTCVKITWHGLCVGLSNLGEGQRLDFHQRSVPLGPEREKHIHDLSLE